MKRNISILLLSSMLLFTACTGNTSVNDNTADGGLANSADKTNGENITEDMKITDADTALERLKKGNERFVNDDSELINVSSERREQLEDGQSPYAVIISCSDSRVTPTLIFNAGLGEIFDIRIAGNVVDDDALGSIEYGVEHLHCPLIVVMGHEKCGAVTAAYDQYKNGAHVEGEMQSFTEKIQPSVEASSSLDEAIHFNIDNMAEEISRDEIVKHALNNGSVKIVKAYYSLSGEVQFY